MEMTKEEILKSLQESIELDEWDPINDPNSERYKELVRTGQLKGQHGKAVARVSKGRAQSDFIRDVNGTVIGFKQIDYNTNTRIGIFHVCGGEQEVNTILNDNPELLAQLREEFGETPLRWTKVKESVACLKHPSRRRSLELHPLPGETGQTIIGKTKKPAETTDSVQDRMKGMLHKMVNETVGDKNDEASMRLVKCSIPIIHGANPKFLDRHLEEWTNDTFVYRTSNSNIYRNAPDFVRDAVTKARSDEFDINFLEKPLKRITSKEFKWSELQGANITKSGTQATYKGKTPWYVMDKMNYTEGDWDVVVKSQLVIKGSLVNQNTYNIKISFVIAFGDKANEAMEQEVRTGLLKLNKTLNVSRSVDLSGTNSNFHEKYTVLDNPLINNAMQEGLEELKQQFFDKLKPVQAVAMAQVRQGRLAEMVDNITEQIMKD